MSCRCGVCGRRPDQPCDALLHFMFDAIGDANLARLEALPMRRRRPASMQDNYERRTAHWQWATSEGHVDINVGMNDDGYHWANLIAFRGYHDSYSTDSLQEFVYTLPRVIAAWLDALEGCKK